MIESAFELVALLVVLDVVTTTLVLLDVLLVVGIMDVVDDAEVVDVVLVVVVFPPPDITATATPAMTMITTIAITAPISLLFMILVTPATVYINVCLNS